MTQIQRIAEFDTWRPGYGGATVDVYLPGTTTRANLYLDAALTTPTTNPQTLQSNTVDGVTYGKFAATIYVGTAYYLVIEGAETTGIARPPMTCFVGEAASAAVATAAIGTASRAIEDWLSDEIRTAAWGDFGVNATTNTAILASAIGAAAAAGGGEVLLPAMNIDFNVLSVPAGVVLCGRGQGATILRSTQGANIVTVTGSHAGLRRLTLDGVSLNALSVGLYAVGMDDLILEDVHIKRFQKGIEKRGGDRMRFDTLSVTNCTRGADLRGDMNAGGGNDGSALSNLRWIGGRVAECTEYGLRFFVEDAEVVIGFIRNVDFADNVGPAIDLQGAQRLEFHTCSFIGNTANLSVADGADTDETETRQIEFTNSTFTGGTIDFAGECAQVLFQNCLLDDVDLNLNTPQGHIMLMDCRETATTTSTGNVEKLVRSNRFWRQEAFGVTTDATPTPAWSLPMIPGEHVRVTGRVIGKARTGNKTASYEIAAGAYRTSSTVTYGSASGAIPVGQVMTGQTSGATASVPEESPAGTLVIRNIDGDFVPGETVQFSGGVTAVLTGPVISGVAAMSGAVEYRVPTFETNAAWDATFNVSSVNLQLLVTGEASLNVDWRVEVSMIRF